MKLAVFGATGLTGQILVGQAIEAGHVVNTVVRRTGVITISPENGRLLTGDVLDGGTVDTLLTSGADAVICLIGIGPNLMNARQATDLFSAGTANIVKAMQHHKIERLIVVSCANSVHQPGEPLLQTLFYRPLLHNVYENMQRMEALVQTSNLKWTIVRAPNLTSGAPTGRYRLGENLLPPHSLKVSRADLANFLLKLATTGSSTGQIVTIGY